MESHNIEYKQEMPESKEMKKEIVSFLNSETGGTIYLGVDDQGKTLNYTSDDEKYQQYKEWEETLSNWIVNAFSPEITGLILIDTSLEIFKISISAGINMPYYFKNGEGFNSKGIYIRVGSTKRRASTEEFRRMISKQVANTFDSSRIQNKELTFTYVKNIFESKEEEFDIIGLEFKKNEDDLYNNAALIISDNNPYVSKLAVFEGIDTMRFKDKKEFKGAIAKQIDEVVQYINLNNKNNIILGRDGKRIESYSYPTEAVRETVMNAFVHRDYTMTSDIKIEMYDDRLAVSSPGSLPDGLTVEDLKLGANAKRNPILINALDKMKYIENYGSGIRRIYSSYKGFNRQPELVVTDNLFKVILYNKNYKLNQLEINDKLIEVVDYLKDGKSASRQEIQDALRLKKSYTLELISTLRKKEIVILNGRGSATRYFLNKLE